MRVGLYGRQILKADQPAGAEVAGSSRKGAEKRANDAGEDSNAPKRPKLVKFIMS